MRRLPIEKIPTLPRPVKAALRTAVWNYGRATAAIRPLPDFLVLGGQRCGSTALYAYLRWDPRILGPSWKEVSYFDRNYARGDRWYRGQFPANPRVALARRRAGVDVLVGEASPSYVFHPLAPERARALVPDARLVVLVRNPVDRALSHYHHEVALKRETLSFEEAIDAEEERTRGEVERMTRDPGYFSHAWWDHTYLARGRWAEQLERWLAVYPHEQLLVVSTEELQARTAETHGRVLEHLGLRARELPEYPRVFEREYPPMVPATRRRLEEAFAGPNARLYELLGRDLGWNAAGTAASTGS